MAGTSNRRLKLVIRSVFFWGSDLQAAANAGVRGGIRIGIESHFQPADVSSESLASDLSIRRQSRPVTSAGTKSDADITSRTSDSRVPFDFFSP